MKKRNKKKQTFSDTSENIPVITQNAQPIKNISRISSLLIYLVIFFWPFLYLADYYIPFRSEYTAMGRDFYPFYYRYKAYLLAHLANGNLPLWSPSEACGYPLFSSPLAQYFYPFNLLLILWYKFAGGYSPISHQIFTILGISIFGLGLYKWLKLLNGNLRAVLFAVLIITVSFKMTENMRFPNGIHTAAWYPWILYALTRIIEAYSVKKMIVPCLVLIFSSFCMITAGYPYFVYYSIFLFIPYSIMLFFKFSRTILIGRSDVCWKTILPAMGFSGSIIVLLSLPYLLCIMRLMEMTYNRSGTDFHYSTVHMFSLQDSLGSLIYPPLAQIEGWYFFSITALLIIILFIVWLFWSPPNPTSLSMETEVKHRKYLLCILLVWIVLISYISYGKNSYLFKLLWQFMPGFSSLRVWGRINIILAPLIAWLLSMAYDAFERIACNQWANTGTIPKKNKIILILTVLGVYGIIVFAQYYFYIYNICDPYWKNCSGPLINFRALFLLLGGIGFTVVLFFLVFSPRIAIRTRHLQLLMFAGLWLAAAIELWPVGAHIWSSREPVPKERFHIEPASFHIEAFNRSRINQNVTVAMKPVYSVGLGSPNWYFDRYINFINASSLEKTNRDILLGIKGNQRIFISESIKPKSIFSFLKDSQRFENIGKLISYDGDELIWELDMPINGYLSFIDNWDPYWKAYVDDKEIPIELLFDTFKSVPLTPGKHRVVFRYKPTLKDILFGTK